MKEKSIRMKSHEVRALLDGRKTQTRMVFKAKNGSLWPNPNDLPGMRQILRNCPYGQPGDRLWVREAFDFLPSGGPDDPTACEIVYWATGGIEQRQAPIDYNPMIYGHQKIRPSIHMPRWASRITLEVTGVRVERLQDISEADAISEGAHGREGVVSPKDHYCHIWETINGFGSWSTNPWVWVIEFKRVTA